jgi:hypothetical protein
LHTFRRMHVFGQLGTLWPGNSQDVRADQNVQFLKDSGVGWVKLWVSWGTLQPNASDAFGTGTAVPPKTDVPATHLQTLDEVITFIKGNADTAISSLKIILSIREVPLWASAKTRKSVENTKYEHKGPNSIYLAFPDAVDVSSPWATFLGWLFERYTRTAANPTRYVDGIDIVNEPNSECWPQVTPSKVAGVTGGTPNAHCIVAQMFGTAVVRREAAMGNLAQSTPWTRTERHTTPTPRPRT